MSSYQHVLIAVDFTPGVDQVVERGMLQASAFGARLSLAHVVEPVALDLSNEMFIPQDLDLDRKLTEAATRLLEEVAVRHQLQHAERFIEQGYVRREVLRLAEEQKVDLIVVGSHGRSGVQLLLGSTANAILHGARCDVLAVRIRD